VISDTHNLLRVQAVAALENSDLIVHAGDICKPEILDELGKIAPLIAVKGNNDKGLWSDELPVFKSFESCGIFIYVIHDIKELKLYPAPPETKLIVYGHSHKPSITERDGVIFLNPGSAGARRFNLPVSVALLKLIGGEIKGEIISLTV
jgi:hypothetical protein